MAGLPNYANGMLLKHRFVRSHMEYRDWIFEPVVAENLLAEPETQLVLAQRLECKRESKSCDCTSTLGRP